MSKPKAKPDPAALQIAQWPIDKVLPYARNARLHSAEQIAQIAASMREFGFVNPVLVDASGTLIAGHGRTLAASQIGLPTVPVIQLGHLTDAQAAALRIADNQLSVNATWDLELLRGELLELDAADVDLTLMGFGSVELQELMSPPNTGAADPEVIPEAPKVPVTKTGDLWLLGAEVKCPKCGKRTPLEKAVRSK